MKIVRCHDCDNQMFEDESNVCIACNRTFCDVCIDGQFICESCVENPDADEDEIDEDYP